MNHFSTGSILAAAVVILHRFDGLSPWVMLLFEPLAM